MFGTYIGNNKMLIKTAYNGMLTISSNDLSLMPSLVIGGLIEAPLTKFFINQIKPGDIVVDVGTNVGYFTLLAARLVGTDGLVIGFEANPDCFDILKENISMNWINERTILKNKAVYSKHTNLKFHASNRFHGDSSIQIRPNNEDDTAASHTIISVDAITLDDELKDIDKIDLLKIDIEGGEYHAFLGMTHLIKQKKIKRIVFEWNRVMLGDEAPLFISLLKEINFSNSSLFGILDADGNMVPTTLESITAVDFYPFALIEFN